MAFAQYCVEIYDRWDPALHPLAQMAKNMEKGMVLAMSAWYDAETYSGGKPVGGTQTGMSWMDGNNLWCDSGESLPSDLATWVLVTF